MQCSPTKGAVQRRAVCVVRNGVVTCRGRLEILRRTCAEYAMNGGRSFANTRPRIQEPHRYRCPTRDTAVELRRDLAVAALLEGRSSNRSAASGDFRVVDLDSARRPGARVHGLDTLWSARWDRASCTATTGRDPTSGCGSPNQYGFHRGLARIGAERLRVVPWTTRSGVVAGGQDVRPVNIASTMRPRYSISSEIA